MKVPRYVRWSRKDKLTLVESLGMYVGVGLSLDACFGILATGLPKRYRGVCLSMSQEILTGRSLSSILADYVRLPTSVISLIACGESTGSLAKTFEITHTLLDKQGELIKKCVSALVYPLVIGTVALGIMIGLVSGVMPQITPLLISLHTKLPLLTVWMIWISHTIVTYGLYYIVGIIGFIIVMSLAWRKLSWFRYGIEVIILKIPLIGSLSRLYSFSVFFVAYGSLCATGMQTDDAYSKAITSIPFTHLRKIFERRAVVLTHGGKINSICDESMPSYVQAILSAGEASGHLADSFLRVSRLIERDIDHKIKYLTSLIEPVMMVGMGAMVGSIALSIMLPIYGISKTLQH